MKKTGLADSPYFEKKKNKRKMQSLQHNILVSCDHDTMVENIVNALRESGKEASTYRLATSEKIFLAEIIFSFRKSQIHISENEIVRMAIHFLLHDYISRRKKSVLAIVIKNLKTKISN